MLRPLFSGKPPMRVAALMSGSGSNLEKIIEKQSSATYQVVVILTDNPNSNAKAIAEKNEIPYEENDIGAFYEKKGKPKKDLALRTEFDQITVKKLQKYKPDVEAYCGYMSIASPVLVNACLGINVHPADLTILKDGKRKYTGAQAVRNAIAAGEKTLRATTHQVSTGVDEGQVFVRSNPVPVKLPKNFNPKDANQLEKVAQENQNRLKEKADWLIFPKTLEWIAEKRFSTDQKGRLFFDGNPCPTGVEVT